MPFKSEKQRRYLWMHEPQLARKWSHKYGSTPVGGRGGKDMPLGNPMGYKSPRKRALALAMERMKNRPGVRPNPMGIAPGERPPGGVKYPPPPRDPNLPLPPKRGPFPDGPPGNEGPIPPGFPNPNRPRDGNQPPPPLNKPPNIPGPRRPNAPTLGVRRLQKLGDKNLRNDKRALIPLIRMFQRAQAGKGFGGKVFGEGQGNTLQDFFQATRPYTKGTGYAKMLRSTLPPRETNPRRRRQEPPTPTY